MKLIIAYVRVDEFWKVKEELLKREIPKFSIVAAQGHGEEYGEEELYRGVSFSKDTIDRTRFEIAVNDNFLEKAIEAISTGARTGKIGDGKIFVINLEDCVRIRTGERGGKAIG